MITVSTLAIFADALGIPVHGVHDSLYRKYYTQVEDANNVFAPQCGETIAHTSESSKHFHKKRRENFLLASLLELYSISFYFCADLHDIYWGRFVFVL